MRLEEGMVFIRNSVNPTISSEKQVTLHPLGILMFALTLSSSSSLVPPFAGIRPLCASQHLPLAVIHPKTPCYILGGKGTPWKLLPRRATSTAPPSSTPPGPPSGPAARGTCRCPISTRPRRPLRRPRMLPPVNSLHSSSYNCAWVVVSSEPTE